MDSGYKFVLDNKPYLIADETDYFAVYEDYKQIAAFKTEGLAREYVNWRSNVLLDRKV